METKPKTFDAVAESRKWREATSAKLDAMSVAERLAHLRGVRERYAAERDDLATAFAKDPAREEPDAVRPAKTFDAVAESRKWKEAVARETAGMSIAERMAYFRRHSSVAASRSHAGEPAFPAAETCTVREEPPGP